MPDKPDTSPEQQQSETLSEHPQTHFYQRKWVWISLTLALLIFGSWLVYQYQHAQALVSISATDAVNPNGGEIVLKYRFPVGQPLFAVDAAELFESSGPLVAGAFSSSLDKSGMVETIRFQRPTPYNRQLRLVRLGAKSDAHLFYWPGLTQLPVFIDFTTPYEQVSLNDLLPTASKQHAPEVLNNQIAIVFNGEVAGQYRKRVKLTPRDVPFIELSPLPDGYYQWSDNHTLTFNFTNQRPRFDTTYQFTVLPEKLINPDYQQWQGDTGIALSTSANDVYVNDVSIDHQVEWNTPVTFEFSGNMVGVLDLNKDKASNVMPVLMTPEVEGSWRWLNARTVRFTPGKNGWPIREKVAIEFLPEVNQESDRNWTDNRSLNRIEFFVKPRTQSIANISLRGDHVDPEAVLEVQFSRGLVDEQVLGVRTSMSQSKPPVLVTPAIKGQYYWASTSKLVIEPSEPWSQLTEYKMAIHPDFNPDDRFQWTGTTEFSFTTAENVINPHFYQIPQTEPSGSAFFGNKSQYQLKDTLAAEQSVWIEFNRPFGKHHDADSTAEGVQITPAIHGEFIWLSDYLLKFTPRQGWKPETGYQIQLSDALLYFHEQHYAEGSSKAVFQVAKDEIQFSTQAKYLPDQPLLLNFNKALSPGVKIGRRYRASELDEARLPIQWKMTRDYEFEWKSAKSLELIPDPYWPSSAEIPFTLAPSLLPRPDSQWHQKNYTIFNTGQNIVAVESITPQGQSSRNTTIDVVFNKQIRPANIAIGAVDHSHLVQISPPLEGDWYWLADNKLVFKPDGPLAPSTDYTLTIAPEHISGDQFTWHDLDEDAKPRPQQSSFHSPYQRVRQSAALFEFDEQNPLKQRFLIDIELSEWTRFEEVEKRFTLWTNNIVDGKNVETPLIYHVTTEEPKDRVRHFRVVSEFIDRPSKDRQVYYQLEKGIPALDGNATMYADFRSDFAQEQPRFVTIKRLSYSLEGRHFSAHLELSAPVEPEKLQTFLTVQDTDRLKNLTYNISVDSKRASSRGFQYLIEADFQPDRQYRFSIQRGLLAADGALTNEEISISQRTSNLQRKVEFALKGNILSKYDTHNITVLTANTDYFDISIDQIYPSNVRQFLNSGLSNEGSLLTSGKQVFHGQYDTQKLHKQDTRNVELTTAVDLSGFFQNNPKGLYRIHLRGHNSHQGRWFLSSDIGLIARRTDDYIYTWAMSLSDALPMAGVTVELVDYWNQTVTKGVTDSAGFVRLRNSDPRNTHLIMATRGSDMSFLDMKTQAENFNGFDASGVYSTHDASLLQAYLYGERGVYRPGDVMHLVGVVRDQEGRLPGSNNLTLLLRDPTGAERFRERYSTDITGVVSLDYNIPDDAKTGKWKAELLWRERSIGSLDFQVEEFIPNKIKVALSTAVVAATPGQTFIFAVQSNNLFGPPAAGRKVTGHVSLRPAYFKPKGYDDYKFGHDDRRFQQLDSDLLETRLDENGHYEYEYSVPEGIDSPIGLNLHYSATVIDDSGRGVAQYAQIPVHLFEQYVGVRRLANNTIELGDTVKFEAVNVTVDGTRIDPSRQSFKYEVFRKRKITHFRKNERGYYRYVTEKVDVPLLSHNTRDNRFDYLTEYSGEHYLQVTDLNGGQVTRFYFNVVGPRDRVSIVEAPEAVLMKARQDTAIVGENLMVDVQAPFAGQLLLIAERDDVIWSQAIAMDSNTTTVSLPISAAQTPNFYLSAIVVQPASNGSRELPVYATGIINVNVRDPGQTPSVQITAPAKVAPNGKLTVQVSVDRLDRGDMYFTLAAVDEGILDLTQFKTPNMKSAFNRKQRLDVAHFSVYPWLMPYNPDTLVTISPSGSAPARALIKKKRENPDAAARVKSVALWSGLQKFGEDGKASVTFDVPEFDGSLRLMLVSFGDQRFNSAETTVTVRDDLVLKPSLPRFMANGDHFELPFTVFNSTAQAGEVTVSVQASDHVELLGNERQNMTLAAGGESRGSFSFNVKDRLGIAHFTLTAQGLNEQTIKRIDVPVRSSGNYVSLSDAGIVDAATPKTIQIPKVFKPGTEVQALRVAPAGLLEFAGSLKYLLNYPHGCLEQTTSKLFPLLYFEEFAKSADFYDFRTSTPRYYLRQGITSIERMQLDNGYFSYWGGSDEVNNYAFLYAAHFLAEARHKGMDINETVWSNLQYRLREDVLNRFNGNAGYQGDYNLSHQVYALYVMALSDQPMVAEMNALLQYQQRQLKLHDRARLAAAFKLAGRDQQAQSLLENITSIHEYDDPYRETSGTFASSTRDLAILLDALIEVDPQAEVIPLIIDKLSSLRRHGRWGSTQDNAMALMALGKSVTRSVRTQSGDVIITLPNGEQVKNHSVDLSTIDLLSGDVSIHTTGDAEANYFWQADGVSNAEAVSDEDHGLKVRRQYLNTKKERVDLTQVRQGDLVIVQLTMSAKGGPVSNVAVTDLLPMGLEIENARLSTSADIPWLKSTARPDYSDIRDDRMNLYLTLNDQEVVYYYTTRAVTLGAFAVPSVRAEAMYDESKYSLSGAGTMKILPMR
ncbi:Ig-like domain-containing protein [Gynuella sunshinyii]|uniref:Large extracellular alpha-helical protein n=1 Tax=Gynuella sunshinyii YC6258 TaxID=1445510 RepID=A0A0C5VUP7_9GAMM|nr:Ig-like domain-containing protein [Gynuella sunshinyii]AJQ97028.1 large extracellular alpha-helical protein [Gynuella sunshinyii YC6258]